jgi:hypothetical protein
VRQTRHRVSLYADGIIMFLFPTEEDLMLSRDIFQLFGRALWLDL